MRALPYSLPIIITVFFISTASTPFVWVAMGLVAGIAFSRRAIGKFSVAEVVAEYDFFHHSPLMADVKTLSGFFFTGFNVWMVYFLATHVLTTWALVIFLYSVVILNSNFAISLAHDLMHSERKSDRLLATILLLQNGFFYLEADHIHIHHRHVGTPADPATARVGEGLYAYLRRSVGTRFRMLFFKGTTFPRQRERTIIRENSVRLLVCVVYLASAYFLGWRAFLAVLAQFVLVTLIYETVTYIQHYGLLRETSETGKPEPVQLHHAWNCYYRTSAWLHYMMPVHSIHHLREERLGEIHNFAGLSMPLPFATMLLTAFVPARWFRLMNERVMAPTRTEKV